MLLASRVINELLPRSFDEVTWESTLALTYLVVAGSALAYTAYVWLLENAAVSLVATYAYVNPIVAVVLGWAVLSEEIASNVAVGAAIILA